MNQPETVPDGVVYCVRHPDVETGLTCGRCGAPICPRCLVHTPGGIRCPDCAMLRRPPMYDAGALDYAKALGIGAVLAFPLGAVGAFLIPPSGRVALFGLIFVFLGGMGAGALIAGAIERFVRKRGIGMQLMSVLAVLLAAVVRFVLSGLELDLVVRDVAGALLVAVAAASAWTRLR